MKRIVKLLNVNITLGCQPKAEMSPFLPFRNVPLVMRGREQIVPLADFSMGGQSMVSIAVFAAAVA
jgi:hypothetical protein